MKSLIFLEVSRNLKRSVGGARESKEFSKRGVVEGKVQKPSKIRENIEKGLGHPMASERG